MKKIEITKRRSAINRPVDQKRTLVALGLRKMNQTVTHNLTPAIQGMVRKVQHLITIKEL